MTYRGGWFKRWPGRSLARANFSWPVGRVALGEASIEFLVPWPFRWLMKPQSVAYGDITTVLIRPVGWSHTRTLYLWTKDEDEYGFFAFEATFARFVADLRRHGVEPEPDHRGFMARIRGR